MAKKKLGKGLSEIFGEDIESFIDDIDNNASTSSNKTLKVDEIRPNPYQPRKVFDKSELEELANSIKENGVFQPILVRKSLSGYELVAGERRLRASKLAGLKEIPVIIKDFNDTQMMEISLLENIQRKDLSPIEEANAYNQLIKKLNYTQEELAKRLGKSRTNITNMLRLLALPSEVQDMVNSNKLSYGQARTLLALDDKDQIIELANKTIKEGLSVRQLEQLTKKPEKKDKPSKVIKTDPFIEDVKQTLQSKYSTKVEIKDKKLIIHYSNTNDLNRILELMDAIEK
jgi:ParB family transcriptional regulator, chromosome partitioning protein